MESILNAKGPHSHLGHLGPLTYGASNPVCHILGSSLCPWCCGRSARQLCSGFGFTELSRSSLATFHGDLSILESLVNTQDYKMVISHHIVVVDKQWQSFFCGSLCNFCCFGIQYFAVFNSLMTRLACGKFATLICSYS